MKSRFPRFPKALRGERGVLTRSTPLSLPLGGKAILAQEWILRVETDDPAELEYPGEGWVSLDRKLEAALTKIAHSEVGREITQMTTTCLNNNSVARGRVLLAIVFRYYASGNYGQAMYDMNHLQTLVLKTTTWNRSTTLGIWF